MTTQNAADIVRELDAQGTLINNEPRFARVGQDPRTSVEGRLTRNVLDIVALARQADPQLAGMGEDDANSFIFRNSAAAIISKFGIKDEDGQPVPPREPLSDFDQAALERFQSRGVREEQRQEEEERQRVAFHSGSTESTTAAFTEEDDPFEDEDQQEQSALFQSFEDAPLQVSSQEIALQVQQLISDAQSHFTGRAQIGSIDESRRIQVDDRVRDQFLRALSGQSSPLLAQAGIQLDRNVLAQLFDPVHSDLPEFRGRQPSSRSSSAIPVRREEAEQKEEEFFAQFQAAEGVLPGRDPQELAHITSAAIRDLGVDPFSTATFNPGIVQRVIRSNVTPTGNIGDRDRLFSTVQDILAVGVAEALESDDSPNNLLGVFATLAQALRDVGGDINNPGAFERVIDRAAFGLISRQGLEDLSFVPQTDVASNLAVEALFGDSLRDAREIPDLSVAEVQQIARDFGEELRQLVGTAGGTQQKFKNIVAWIDNNVKNPDLKAAIRSQARSLEVETIRIESAQKPNVPPELVPLSEGRGVLISRDVAINFANILELNINQIGALDSEEDRIREADRLVDETNKVLRQFRITTVRGGRNVTPTISKLEPSGRPRSTIELIQNLQKLVVELPSPRSEFRWLPTKAEGQPINTKEIVEDLRSRFTKQGARSKAARKSIIHPSKLSEFGEVSILTMKRENGSSEFEIVIPPNASMEDILMVVNALLMEDGMLFDVDGKHLLNIKKGLTSIAEVLMAIRKEQTMMMGVEIRLEYIPKSLVGGSYLGGALSVIMKKPLFRADVQPAGISRIPLHMDLLRVPFHVLHKPVGGALFIPHDSAGTFTENKPNVDNQFHIQITPESENRLNAVRHGEDRVLPEGGNIFGDIFGAVASVVTLPLQVVGSLLGGELPPDLVRELEMDARRSVTAR